MIRPIMTKKFFLRQPSEPATADDLAIARDLVDTLEAHRDGCVGMAANMIGERKRIIAVLDADGSVLPMLNPRIVRTEGEYRAQEGCLSLEGLREAVRFERIDVEVRFEHIDVEYEDLDLQPHSASFSGRVAQAIQHEIDHCEGVLI